MLYTRKLVMSFIIIFATIVMSQFLGYLLRIYLVRSLTPTEYGLLYAIMGMFGLVSFIQSLGLTDALTNAAPGLSPKKAKTALLTVLYTQIIFTIVLAGIIAGFSPWLAENFLNSPGAFNLVIIFSLVLILGTIDMTLVGFIQGRGKTSVYGYIALLRAAVLLGLSMLLLPSMGLLGVGIAYLLTMAVIPIVLIPILGSTIKDYGKQKSKIDFRLLRRFLIYGMAVTLTGGAGILLTYVDTFFLTLFRTLEEVGLYNIALPTANLVLMVSAVLQTSLFPITSEIKAKHKIGVFKEGIAKIYTVLLLLLVPIGAVLLLYPEMVLAVLFGYDFVVVALTLQFLTIGCVMHVFTTANHAILAGIERPRLAFYGTLVAGVANVILDILLIPKYGIEGSAIATLISFTLLFLLSVFFLRKYIKFTFPVKRFIKIGFSALGFLLCVAFLKDLINLPIWYELIFVFGISGLLYLGLLFFTGGITKSEILELKDQIHGRIHKQK